MYAVTSTPSGWAAIGTVEGAPAAWTSPNGADWFRAGMVHSPETMINPGWTIASSSSGLIAVGVHIQFQTASTILASADGDMWEPATGLDSIAEAGINSVTGFRSHFIAVGGHVEASPSLWTTFKK
jgi:hypothetical protein